MWWTRLDDSRVSSDILMCTLTFTHSGIYTFAFIHTNVYTCTHTHTHTHAHGFKAIFGHIVCLGPPWLLLKNKNKKSQGKNKQVKFTDT